MRYDYQCSVCGIEEEYKHSVHENPEFLCPVCGHAAPPMKRVINKAPAARFLGSGWAKDGYSMTDRETDAAALKADRINAKVANDTAKKGGGGGIAI